MKSLNNYISQNNNKYLQFVQESLDNNTRIINESKLITEHGKDIDNLLFKTKQYFNNHIYGLVSESENDYKFTLDEQQTARDLLIYCLEDYKEVLLNECNIYEGLLNDTLSINEAEFQLGAAVSNLWKQGKDKVVKIYNDAKTKIKEINELIIMFAKKSFKSLKEFANKIVDVLETLNDSLLGIAKKIGFGEDKVAEISDELAIDIKNNPDKITKSDIFESLGKEINEGVVDWIQNSKAGKWYADKKQKPLWNAFFQVCNWLLVCKVLPAVVLAVFPGGLIYYIVSIVIKVIWNIKKLKGLIKQTQDYVHSWNTMTTWEKIWKAAALLAIWYLWFNNVMSIAGNISKVGDAVKKAFESGELWKQMFGQAHTGIEPDKLEAMGAAVIRWIGKGFSGSISDAYDEIMNACKEATGTEAFEAAKKAIEEGKAAAEAAKKTMENTESLTKEIEDEVKNFDGNKSTDLLNKIKSLCNLTPGELKDKIIYRVWVDGTATTKAAWLKNLIEEAKAAGMDESVLQKTQDLLNNSLHAVDSGAGSVSFMELPGEMVKFAAGKDLLGKNGWFGIVGEIAKNVATGGGNLPDVDPFSSAMATDVPIITFKQKGNGFRVRLGDKDSKNYIYEVGKDDVKTNVKPTEIDNNKVKSAYENIKKVITEENKKFIEKIKNSDLKEDEKKKIIKQVEIFDKGGKDENGKEHKPYAEELAKTPLIVIYGKRLTKEEQEKYDGKESLSLKSLHDYLIKEAEESKNDYTVKDIINNLTDLRKHFEKVVKNTPVKQENEENHKEKSTSQDDTFKGNTQMMLRSIFKLTKSYDKKSGDEKNSTANFKYEDDFKPEPYKSIVQRVKDNDPKNDKFGKEDIAIPAAYLSIIYENKKYCENLQYVFVDVLILKEHLLKIAESTKLNDISDDEKQIIIGCYKTMVYHLKQSNKFQTQIDNKEWVPLEFNESINDKTKEQIKKTEDKNTINTTPKDVENKLDDANVTVESPEPEEQSNNQSEEQPKEDDESGYQPVLIFSNVYGMDIAAANKQGPRKEMYSLKGAFHSLEFIEIKKGMNKHDIQEMLGEWMHTMVNNLCNITAVSPFEKKKDWWKDKFIPNKNLKEDEERREFGYLTNGEIADIMNKKENAKNYVLSKTNNISIAQNEKDNEYLAKKEEEYAKKLENPKEEIIKSIKAAYPDAIDKDGKIKKDYKDENGKTLPQIFSNYSLAKRKAEDAEKSGGLLTRLKNAVKNLFSGDKERGKKVNSALTNLDESLNESIQNLNKYDEFLDECFSRMSLKDYIKYN